MASLVSVIIPTYNRAHFIGETLDSVIAQTYKNWECIVVDDGSEDYTDELMEFYCKRDSRIQYYHRPKNRPKGANACRNYGFELSKGEYIQWLDSDDLLGEGKIEDQVSVIAENEKIDLVFCDYLAFKDQKENNYHPNKNINFIKCDSPIDLFNMFGENNAFLPPSCYLSIRNKILLNGGWNEYLKINQDGEYFVRTLLKCDKIEFVSNATVFYRQNSNENRVSNYDSLGKAEHAVISWKLIESYFQLEGFHKGHSYIKYGKNNIFYTLRVKGYLNIIKKNSIFFNRELKPKRSLKTRFFKKLKKIIN